MQFGYFDDARREYVITTPRTPDGFDTSREAFLGVYGSPAKPQAVFGGGCTGSVAHGWQPVAAQELALTLSPGETWSVILGLGYIENPVTEKWAAPAVERATLDAGWDGAWFRRACPAYTEAISEVHRTEPYVYSQMIAGRDAPSFGEAKISWLAGMQHGVKTITVDGAALDGTVIPPAPAGSTAEVAVTMG